MNVFIFSNVKNLFKGTHKRGQHIIKTFFLITLTHLPKNAWSPDK